MGHSIKALKRIFRDWRGYYKWLGVSLLLTAGSVASTLAIPYFSSFLINEGIMAGNNDYLSQYGLYMILAAIFAGLCEVGNTAIAVSFSEETSHGLRTGAYQQIQKFSFGNIDRFRSSDLLVRLTTDIQNVKIGIQQGIMNIFRAPLMLIVAIILLWITTPQLFWIGVVMVITVGLVLVIYLWLVSKAYDERQIKYDRLNQILRESMAGIRVVKAFVRQGLENHRFQKSSDDLKTASLKPQHYYALVIPTLLLMAYLGIAGIYYFGGVGVLQGTGLTVGGVTAAMQYILLALTPLFILGSVMPFLSSGISSLRRVYRLIDEEPDIKDTEHPKTVDYDKLRGSVSFKDVCFGYPVEKGDEPVEILKDINLTIEPGEVVGFLGATGSGKSTLVNLIPRFYDVTGGKVTIDGIDVREITLETLHQLVGVCLQESYLFSGTIQDNIVMGAPDTSYDVMVQAAQAADAHGFVTAIPEKYEGHVARKGADFSGGQRQRLSIARTLMLKPKILILDDSTSACDVATEARIQDAVRDMMRDVTQIIVAQRISSVITADKIVLMEKGEIVAVGSHEDLLRSSKLYQEIYISQLGGGVPESDESDEIDGSGDGSGVEE